jgi:hypothetical protein
VRDETIDGASEDPVTGPGVRLVIRALDALRRRTGADRATPEGDVESQTEAIAIPRTELAISAAALAVGLLVAAVLFYTVASDEFQSIADYVVLFYCLALAGPGGWALKQVTTFLLRRAPIPKLGLDTTVEVLAGVTIATALCAVVLRLNQAYVFSSLPLELVILCLPSFVAWISLSQGRRRAAGSS